MGKSMTPWEGKTQDDVLKLLAPHVIRYCKWYCENGIHLPSEFGDDPGKWTFRLRNMQHAFEKVKDNVPLDTLNAMEYEDYKIGISDFYKHFQDLWL